MEGRLLSKDSKKESMDLFVNEALRGKPYLDIDRVIPKEDHIKKERKNN